jgi:hypothetical protein
MEVHHSHHNPPGKEEKSWKHYAIDFFMLFLAVSLGFFTENLRDHYLERERAREMAVGLYNDLKGDLIDIQKTIDRSSIFISEMNALIKTLNDKDVMSKVTYLTYYQASFMLEIDMPVPSTANIDQLTNSGSLRYFRDKKLVTEISQWDHTISYRFGERSESDQKRLIEEIKSVSRVFYPAILDSVREISFNSYYKNQNPDEDVIKSLEKTHAKLITYDASDINEVIGWASERKRNAIVRSSDFLPGQVEFVRKLMSKLNTEFDITNE